MQQTADPIAGLCEAVDREIDHLKRNDKVDFREEMQFRLYPLLFSIIETLTERIDTVYEELVGPRGTISIDLAGRIIALLGRYGEALRAKAADEPLTGELEAEAKGIVAEVSFAFGEGELGQAPAATEETEQAHE